jgi:hypothetical protein
MIQLINRLVVVTGLVFFSILAVAQKQDSLQIKPTFLPFDSVAKKLEAKYNVKFFYDPNWFDRKEISSKVIQMPLDEATVLIAKIGQLAVSKLNDSYYIFLPPTQEALNTSSDNLSFYEIGDVLSYGSKSNAIVKGEIINGSSSEALIGAKINLTDLNISFESDHLGRFLMNIPVGEHEVKIIYPGFEDKTMRIKVFSDGSISIEMYLKTIMLDEVSVTSVKVDQYYRRTKMSVMSIDAKTIRELPTNLGETDVIKGLSLLPGVQTTGEFGSGFNVRGGSADQNLVLIEEVPIFNTSHLFGLTSILNPDGISEATLYKGGIPVTYGERASSILSVKMGEDNLQHAQVKGGIGLLNSRLSIEIPVKDKLTLILGGRTSYSDWMLKQIPDPELKNSAAGFNDLNLFLTCNLSHRDKITLFAYSSNDKFSFSGNHNYNYGNALGSFNFSHRFNGKLYTNILVGLSYYNAGLIENDTLTRSESYKITNSVLYRNLKWNLIYNLNENHILTLGANGFLYDIYPGKVIPYGEDSKVSPQNIEKENGLEWAGYLGDDFKVNEKIGIEFGIRYSGFNYLGPKKINLYEPNQTKSAESIIDSVFYKKGDIIKTWSGIEPRFSLRYNFNSSSSIRFSYNRINQYINLISNTSVISPTDLWKLSDNYVKPLISDQIAIGYFKNYKNNSYETSLELYYKPYKNLIEYKNGAKIFLNNHIETDLIPAIGESYGAELYIKKNNGKLTGWVSYTLSKSLRRTTSNNPDEQVNKNAWFPDNLDRPQNLVINGGYYINKRWKFGFTFDYNTGRPVTIPELKFMIKDNQIVYYSDRNKYRMPDYHRLDLSISRYESLKIKKKWKGYWTVSVINVYGRKNAYSIFYQRDRSPYNYDEGRFDLYKMYIIGRPLPTFTYNFVF